MAQLMTGMVAEIQEMDRVPVTNWKRPHRSTARRRGRFGIRRRIVEDRGPRLFLDSAWFINVLSNEIESCSFYSASH